MNKCSICLHKEVCGKPYVGAVGNRDYKGDMVECKDYLGFNEKQPIYFEDAQPDEILRVDDTNDIIKKTDYIETFDGVGYNAINLTQMCLDFIAGEHKVWRVKWDL